MNSLFRTITSSLHDNVVSMTPKEQSMVSFEMIEKIHIDALDLSMNIGVTDEERVTKQKVIVSMELDVENNEAWQQDHVDGVVSYADIITIIETIARNEVKLVETMAKKIITACYNHSDQIKGVSIKIDKPDIFDQAEAVGCMIESYKND